MEMRIIDSVRMMRADMMRVSFSMPSSFIHSYCREKYCFSSSIICRMEGGVLEWLIYGIYSVVNCMKVFRPCTLAGKPLDFKENQTSFSTALSSLSFAAILLTRFSMSSRLNLMPFSRSTSLILLRVSSPFSGAKSIPRAAPMAAPVRNPANNDPGGSCRWCRPPRCPVPGP